MAYKKFFPAQEESEKVFLLIRRHWFTYSIFWILTFLMLLPIAALIIIWTGGFFEISPIAGNLLILGGSIYLLGLLALLLYGFVDYYLDVYIVTDRRIVDIRQNGFFRREISELFLTEVQDVNAKVIGFFPTVLHFGEVIIQTAGEIDNFMFNSVPHPYQISKTIMDLHERIVSDFSDEDEEDRKHRHMSEIELSKGRFNKDAVKLTQDFLREDHPRKLKKEEECECDANELDGRSNKTENDKNDQKVSEYAVGTKEGTLFNIADKKESLLFSGSKEVVLEEGKQTEIK